MIKRFQLTDGSLIPVESEGSPIQIYINPDTLERNALRATFNMDDHTLSSALDPDEVSRIEFHPDHMLLIWKRPTNYSGEDSFFFNVASIGLLLFKERLVIIVTDDIQLAGTGTRQISILRSPLDVMLELLFSTIHHYQGHLNLSLDYPTPGG
jgi:magnesium transporter